MLSRYDNLKQGLPEALNTDCTAMELGVWVGLSHTAVTRMRQTKGLDVKKSTTPISQHHRQLGLNLHAWLLGQGKDEIWMLSQVYWTERKLNQVLLGKAQLELLDLILLEELGFNWRTNLCKN